MLAKIQDTSAQNFLWDSDSQNSHLGLPERIFLLSVSDTLMSFFSGGYFYIFKLTAPHI